MASRAAEKQDKPEPGQILIVIHDFSARGSDELSLSKGDRVELIERDDGFGDGWYLGRHLINRNSGLFPEVYTSSQPFVAKFNANKLQSAHVPFSPTDMTESPRLLDLATLTEAKLTNKTGFHHHSNALTSKQTAAMIHDVMMQSKSINSAVNAQVLGQESPVMNETLSVIDEHITDLNSPHLTTEGRDRSGTNNSGSDYSSPTDPGLSYLHGDDTDDDDEIMYTREQIVCWNPDQVSEYLFTIGVEPKHCEVLRDQEITGDVLLGMDQSSIFLKEFDFGSVGRRLKTWQKIKSLQDDANGDNTTRINRSVYSSDHLEDVSRLRSCSTNSPSQLIKAPGVNERHSSTLNTRLSHLQCLRTNHNQSLHNSCAKAPIPADGCLPGDNLSRNSAESRDIHPSRHGSTNKTSIISPANTITSGRSNSSHRKQASFDRDWTMQASDSPSHSSPVSLATGAKPIKGLTTRVSTDTFPVVKIASHTMEPQDCGYLSSEETESRFRSIIRRRESIGIINNNHSRNHSRNSGSTDEHRSRGSSAHKRHSKFGSVDSTRDSAPPSAAAKYYGLAGTTSRRRTSSETSTHGATWPFQSHENPCSFSPTVTKLGAPHYVNPIKSPEAKHSKSDFISTMKSASSGRFGLRAISDAVTGHEKSRVISPPEPALSSSSKESPIHSSSLTGSSTHSGGPSFDLESPGPKSASSLLSSNSNGRTKKKSKKETSAYTCGLEKKTPKEAIAAADYSGWMKKRSTNLMSSWKPRLFILKGRRLSYYYSEDDDEERGLIDISFHRVLPADNDRIAGLHATLTGATHTPITLGAENSVSAAQLASEPESTLAKVGDSMFIFKLVPPRAGLQRAVTFTKPTVHYFAVPNVKQGRLWMAALMKATIERDESVILKSTYQQKTISLAKARAMRHRPPALMNVDEQVNDGTVKSSDNSRDDVETPGMFYKTQFRQGDSGVSGFSKFDSLKRDSIIQGSYLECEKYEDQPNTA